MISFKPISLILLVHQEAATIEEAIADFYYKVISKIPGSEFIVCEDGSTDGTKEILERIRGEYGLSLHLGSERLGYTRAMHKAFALAQNDIVFYSDSDGQHDPNDFWKMYPLMDTYDIVVGWKRERQDGIVRNSISKVYSKIIAWYFGVRLHDIDCGFRLMKKEVVNFFLSQNWILEHCVNSELTIKAYHKGFKVTEVPVTHLSRKSGKSRAVPTTKLPYIIVHILKRFGKIKKDVADF